MTDFHTSLNAALNASQPTRPSGGENVDSEATTGEPARPTLAGSPVRWLRWAVFIGLPVAAWGLWLLEVVR
jgi:hypothetical protein